MGPLFQATISPEQAALMHGGIRRPGQPPVGAGGPLAQATNNNPYQPTAPAGILPPAPMAPPPPMTVDPQSGGGGPTGGLSNSGPTTAAPANSVAQGIATALGAISPAPAGTLGGLVSAMGMLGLTNNTALSAPNVGVINSQSTNNVTADVNANIDAITAMMGLAAATGNVQGMAPGLAAATTASGGSGNAGSVGNAAAAAASAAGGSAGGESNGGNDSFKKGGMVHGSGPKEITAHGGEYILSKATVMEYGIKYLDKLNKQKLPKPKRK